MVLYAFNVMKIICVSYTLPIHDMDSAYDLDLMEAVHVQVDINTHLY